MPKLIVGNWKMNGLGQDSRQRALDLIAWSLKHAGQSEMVLCPPFTMISTVADILKGSPIKWAGQDCHGQPSGAFTGDVSAQMLKDLGCSFVILGHSERRQYHKESSEQVETKAKAAQAAGLTAIVCVGETDAERTAGNAGQIVKEQLAASIPDMATAENTVIAYEPVWAIGTGKTASGDDVRQMHALIRSMISQKIENGSLVRLLYGGSVKASNAKEILSLPNVDGVLVGGASLKVDEFTGIAGAMPERI